MVTTTFQNPACAFPVTTQNVPPTRATTLCLVKNKKAVLSINNNARQTKNQRWAYLSTVRPPFSKTICE
jgi:hypothetical protein